MGPERIEAASAMLARAFQDDPAWEWVVPSAERRAALLPWLFRVNFEVTEAEVWVTEGDSTAARAGCRPGGREIHIGPMLRALVATPIRVREATSRFLAYGRAVEAMRAAAVPEPHWYLAGIGVEPGRRRNGIGARAAAARARGLRAATASRARS